MSTATEVQTFGRFPMRRVISLAFIGAAVVGGLFTVRTMLGIGSDTPTAAPSAIVEPVHAESAGAWFYRGQVVAIPVDGYVAKLTVTVVGSDGVMLEDGDGDTWTCNAELRPDSCEPVITAQLGQAKEIGYRSESAAAAACDVGVVKALYRAGAIAGYGCFQ